MLEIYLDVRKNDKIHVNADLFQFTRSNLINAIEKVYPGLKYSDPDFDIVTKLRQNVSRFAGYKTAWQVSELKDVDDADAINNINKKYNTNWMRTEYVHTVRSTRAAKNWQTYVADSDLYPYLEYMPSTAAEPRNQHKLLYGVIRPLTDPFWDTWMPPADWGCQCSVQQRRSDKGTNQPPEEITLPPATMRTNPGKEGIVFGDQHSMIKGVPGKLKKAIDEELKILNNQSETRDVITSASELIGKSFRLKIDNRVIDVSVNKNSIEKNLRWDQWFDLRCICIRNLADAMKKAKYIESKKVIKDDFTEQQWKKKRYIKQYHFFHLNLGNFEFQFDIEERYDKQISLYNIKVLK